MRTFQQIHRFGAALARRRRMIVAAALACAAPTFATDYTWTGASNVYWNDPNNWNPVGVPTSVSKVTFPTTGSNISVGYSISGATIRVNSLVFNSANDITLNPAANPIEITSGNITQSAGSGSTLINTYVFLEANGVWNVGGSSYLNVFSLDEGLAGLRLTKTGTGTLLLANSLYTGATNINAGTLQADSTSLGSGPVTVAAGATLAAEFNSNIFHALTINGDGASGVGALSANNGSWGGNILLGTSSSVGVLSTFVYTISGLIDDGALTRNFTKTGGGRLILSHANTYNGSTTVSQGMLQMNNPQAIGAGLVTIASGASLIPTNGQNINNGAFINADGANSDGATFNESGSLQWNGNITLQSNSRIGSNGDELLITGVIGGGFNLTKPGPGNVNVAGGENFTGDIDVS